MTLINNNESGANVRSKLNDLIISEARELKDLATLQADTTLTYTTGQDGTVVVGDIVRTRKEGFAYEVLAFDASGHITNSNGTPVQLRALAVNPGIWFIEQFAGAADNSSDNAAPANIATSYLASIGGGRLVFGEAGTYLLEDQGANPNWSGHRHCISIPGDNITIEVAAGAVLKLADSQQVDANGPVDIITWSNARTNITICGEGKITGNTAGQAGWSGGYAQNTNGNIIMSSGSGGGGNYLVSGLSLEDHWSNPVNIGLNATSRIRRVKLDGITCKNTGEGAQVIDADVVDYINVTQLLDSGITMAGDMIELAECTDFRLVNPVAKATSGTPAGSAIDIFGSQNGIVSGFLIDGCIDAFGLSNSGSVTVDDVQISNGIIKNLTSSLCLPFAEGRLVYRDIEVFDCAGALFQSSGADTLPPAELYNVKGDNCGSALVAGTRKVIWRGGGNINCTGIGIDISQSSASTRTIEFDNLDFRNGTTLDFRFNDAGSAMTVVGHMRDILTVDATNKYGTTTSADFTDFRIRDVGFGTLASNVSPPTQICFFHTLTRTANNLTTLLQPAENQVIVVEAGGSFSVIDRTQSGGNNIYLAGAINFAMTSGDRLVLKWNGSGWYEISRTVT